MRGTLLLIVVVLVLPACGGCLSMPNVVHPGSESSQQARARIFEPYPENDAGPPIAVLGRGSIRTRLPNRIA